VLVAGFQCWPAAVPVMAGSANFRDCCDDIAELGWEPVVEVLSAPPGFPALLADGAVVS
jgi:hypothetical protein